MISTVKNLLYLVIFTMMLNISCQKDESLNPTFKESNSSVQKIAGRVLDKNGNPVVGATVVSNGKTTTTGNFGQFNLTDVIVNNSRIVVKCEHNGYFTGTATEIPSETGVTYVQITLQQATTTESIPASTGGTATLSNGSSVEIPANAIVDKNGNAFTGNVTVAIAHLDPTDPEFGKLIQGSDMQAVETDGDNVTLYSYGILRVELSDGAGNELQLASGKESIITVPIPSSMITTAPSTIPLWYFDENEGIWKEEGEAKKVGNQYVGIVEHFTDWNCDVPTASQATVSGVVLDCDNNPMPHVYVRTGQTYTWTDAKGNFFRRVPSGIEMTCKIDPSFNGGLSSDSYKIPALSSGESYRLGNIPLVTCPSYLIGTITNCEEQPVSGWVNVSSFSNSDFVYAPNGSFKIRVATNSEITVDAYSDLGGMASAKMTTSANMGDINTIGNIKLCNPVNVLGENSFTISGDGFSNQNVILEITNFVFTPASNDKDHAVGSILDSNNTSTDDDILLISAFGTNNLNNSAYPVGRIRVSISESSTGTYSLGPHTINLTLKEHADISDYDYVSESGTITIAKIENKGGYIEGTFSGIFYKTDDASHTTPITITNGKFSVIRLANNTYFY